MVTMNDNILAFVLSIAGIIFGGGMIGQLIMFFVKRYDEKQEKLFDLYHIIYEKLCNYKNQLSLLVLEFLSFCDKQLKYINEMQNTTDTNISQLEGMIKTMKEVERKCRNGKFNENLCKKCQQIQERLPQLYNDIEEKRTIIKEQLETQQDYWNINADKISSIIISNINIHNFISTREISNKNISKSIKDIDLYTLKINSSLHDNRELPNMLIAQMEKIEHVLALLTKYM